MTTPHACTYDYTALATYKYKQPMNEKYKSIHHMYVCMITQLLTTNKYKKNIIEKYMGNTTVIM